MLLSHTTMKSYLAFIVVISLSVLPLWANPVKLISYTKALQFALNNNPKINNAKASIEGALGALKQADSMKWPHLDLETNEARTNNPMSVFGYKLSQGNASFADFGANQYLGPSTLFTKPEALNHPGYYSNLDTAFKLNVPIYSGGKIKAQQTQMRALLASTQHGNQQAQNQLAYQLYVSYEGVLTAIQLIEVAKIQASRAKEFLSITRDLKKQSLTLESDVLMGEAYVTSSLLGLSNAKIQKDNELDGFRTLLGDPDSEFIPNRHANLFKKVGGGVSLIRQAINDNPILKTLRARLEAEKAAVTASHALYKPHINMQLRHDWNGNTIGSGLPSDTIALGANWNLFSAGERSGSVQVAIANAKKIQFEIDEQCNQIKLLLKQVQRQEQQLHYELQLSRKMVKKEEEVIEKLKQRFGRGLLPLGALQESQMKLTQSKVQELQAIYQLRINRAHLLMLSNQLIPKATQKA